MHDRPFVSIVMSTFNRRALLEDALTAISRLDWPRDRLEVVVVDNGSTDGTAAWLMSDDVPLPVSVLRRETNASPAVARNEGLALATGDVIAFTDDDCRPTERWLRELVGALDDDVGIAQGLTRPDPTQRLGPLSRSQWTLSELGLYETCNIAYRRDVLDLEGPAPFSTRLPRTLRRLVGKRLSVIAFGEDTELAWRIKRRGVRSVFVEAAVVHHHVYDGDLGYVVRRSLLAAGFPALVKACPELARTLLWRRVFLDRRHAAGWLGVLCLAASPVQPVLTVGVVPYLWEVLRVFEAGSRRMRLARGLVRVLQDAIEGPALLYGSLRTGRLVL